MKTKYEEEMLAMMSKNRDSWKGSIYFNRQDPRVIVPKYYPIMGWTLNFANPYAYLSLISVIIIIVISSLIF